VERGQRAKLRSRQLDSHERMDRINGVIHGIDAVLLP